MNKYIPNQGKLHFLIRNSNDGFTLIELLVVIIFIGILAALSLPNLLSQVGKARETEAKNYLGTISRSQQAYHFEKQTFANTIDRLQLDIDFSENYYYFPNPINASQTRVKHQAIPSNLQNDGVRNYAVGVYFSAGQFNVVFCQGNTVGASVNAPNDPNNECTNNGTKIR